jgi:6-phosphogluconolactonase (cycloisomerase 2 family)
MTHDGRTSWSSRSFTLSIMALLLAALCGCGGSSHKVLYALGLGSPSVAIFQVSSAGELTVTTSNVNTGSGPDAIAIDPKVRFAYILDSACTSVDRSACGSLGPGGVSQYTLNKSSGALAVATISANNGTTPPSTPALTGVNPSAIVVNNAGTLVFVANTGSNSISVYSIDSTGGALTEVKQPPPSPAPTPPNCVQNQPALCPLATAGAPIGLATTGSMLFVAMSSAGAGSVATYTFDSTGLLTDPPASTTAAGMNPSAMQMDSSGKFLFVTDADTNQVAVFSIGSSGQLAAAGTPADTGTTPVSVSVQPNGKFLYTANQGSNDVSIFSIDSSGGLTPLSGSPVAAGTSPSYVTTDSAGKFLFVANRDSGNISVFTIDSSGGLKAVSGSPFASVVLNPIALASIN